MWMFKFALEMPTKYFYDEETGELLGAYVFNYATYQDTAQELDPVTVACGITLNDPDSQEVFEYDQTFSAAADLDKPAPEGNDGSKVNE